MRGAGIVSPQLTTKQQRFVDFYDGNATDAAEKAGYAHPRSQGQRLLTKVDIQNAIKKREQKRNDPAIATREDRQRFWTNVMANDDEDMKNRLKASELLGRSEADFTDNVKDTTPKKTKEIEATGPLGQLMGKVYVRESE